MKVFLCTFICLFIPLNVMAIINIGGYVPFGLNTQKSEDGGKNTFSFKPTIGVNTVMPIPNINHVFVPEFGLIPEGKQTDEYKKTTFYFLLDVGYLITESFLLRYGLGTYMTKISGDGGQVTLGNGSSTSLFYRPKEGQTSWNTTLDLGIEFAFNANNALRIEAFLFSWLSSHRKLSYSLSYSHYL